MNSANALFVELDRAWLDNAIDVARNAFAGWSATPFGSRKEILAGLLNRIEEYADELSALLAAEQGGPRARARWEIDLLTRRTTKDLELFINREPEETLVVIDSARGVKVRREPRDVVDSKRWCSIKDVIDSEGDRGICK